jgi:Lar family restriction alleviation protein
MKPCPFCGSETVEAMMFIAYMLGERNSGSSGTPTHIGLCMRCLVRGPERKTRRSAIAAWNRRP